MPSKKILIVEDNADWQKRIRERVEGMGYEVVLAGNVIEARLRILVAPKDYVLILLDPSLSAAGNDIEGLVFLRQIRQEGIQTSCVLLTANLTKSLAKTVLGDSGYQVTSALEKTDFVLKPQYVTEIFRRAIRQTVTMGNFTEQVRKVLPGFTSKAKSDELLSLWASLKEHVGDESEFQDVARAFMRAFSKVLHAEMTEIYTFGRWTGMLLSTSHTFQNTALPDRLPFAFHCGSTALEDDLDVLRRLLDRFGYQKFVVIPVFGKHNEIRRLQDMLKDKLELPYAIEAIVLNTEEIKKVMSASRPDIEFQHIVFTQVNRLGICQYQIQGPVDKPWFFGRELELRQISKGIARASFAISGGRRIGKTSILKRLHRTFLPEGGFYTVFLDWSNINTYDNLLDTKIQKEDWQPEPPPGISFAGLTFHQLIQSPPSDVPLVLLFDEADPIVRIDRACDWQLFNTLRALANTRSVRVILTGERVLRDALSDGAGPLFNFAHEILLGPLNLQAVRALVVEPMKESHIELVDDAAIVRRIYDFTSGHPNLVQRLCHRLVARLDERSTRRLSLKDVDEIIVDREFQREDFLGTYWAAASPLEKIISLLMAANQDVRTLNAVRQALAQNCNLHPRIREIDNALQRLVDLNSILKRTHVGYDFAVGAFPQVVTRSMTLDDMLESLKEEYEEQSK